MIKDEATKVGIDAMIKGTKFGVAAEDGVGALASDLEYLQMSMERLLSLLEVSPTSQLVVMLHTDNILTPHLYTLTACN